MRFIASLHPRSFCQMWKTPSQCLSELLSLVSLFKFLFFFTVSEVRYKKYCANKLEEKQTKNRISFQTNSIRTFSIISHSWCSDLQRSQPSIFPPRFNSSIHTDCHHLKLTNLHTTNKIPYLLPLACRESLEG